MTFYMEVKTMSDFEMKVWAQMFFEDGSVSEGKRFPVTILDDDVGELRQIAVKFLNDLNRTEGLLLVWGCGEIVQRYFKITSAFSMESNFSASEPSIVSHHEHNSLPDCYS